MNTVVRTAGEDQTKFVIVFKLKKDAPTWFQGVLSTGMPGGRGVEQPFLCFALALWFVLSHFKRFLR